MFSKGRNFSASAFKKVVTKSFITIFCLFSQRTITHSSPQSFFLTGCNWRLKSICSDVLQRPCLYPEYPPDGACNLILHLASNKSDSCL